MDKGSSRGIISGILGTSHISQQRSNEVVQYEESEYSDRNTSEAAPTKISRIHIQVKGQNFIA